MKQAEAEVIGTLMEPDPIGFSFLAPGWGYLLMLLFLAGAILGLISYLKYLKNRYRRDAIRLLLSISASEDSVDQGIFRIAETVKRVSMQSYGRIELASLNGEAWMAFLETKNEGKSFFSENSQKLFCEQLYKGRSSGPSDAAMKELINDSINWIKLHRV